MVGLTGVLEAAVKAVEAVDACAGREVDAVLATGGRLLTTAAHGLIVIQIAAAQESFCHVVTP